MDGAGRRRSEGACGTCAGTEEWEADAVVGAAVEQLRAQVMGTVVVGTGRLEVAAESRAQAAGRQDKVRVGDFGGFGEDFLSTLWASA